MALEVIKNALRKLEMRRIGRQRKSLPQTRKTQGGKVTEQEIEMLMKRSELRKLRGS